MRTLFFFLFLWLFFGGNLIAQKETSFTFGIKDGLPSNNVYTIFQDDQNLLWFGTDKGIVQYDGTAFRNYDLSDGLEDLEIFCIEQDHLGRLWFAGFNGRICFIQNGQVHNSVSDPWLNALDFKCLIRDIYEDQQGRVWICGENGFIKMLEGKQLYESYLETGVLAFLSDKQGHVYAKPYRNQEWIHKLIQFEFIDGVCSKKPVEIDVLKDEKRFEKEEAWTFHRSPSTASEFNQDVLHRFKDLTLVEWDIRVFESEHYSCNSTFHNGFHFYRKQNGEYIEMDIGISSSTALSWMIEDHQHNLWVSTIGKGLVEIVQSDIRVASNSLIGSAVQSSIVLNDSTIAVGTQLGAVWVLSPSEHKKLNLPTENGRIRTLLKHGHDLLVGTDGGFYQINLDTDVVSTPLDLRAWKELRKHNDTIYGATSSFFVRFESDSLTELYNERTLCFLPMKDDRILLAHLHGLFESTPKGKRKVELQSLGFATINKLECALDSTFLFICSNGNGLIILNQTTGVEQIINREAGLEGNNVYDLFQPDLQSLWLATNEGLVVLKLAEQQWEIKQVIKLNYASGSNDIFTLCALNQMLFLGTPNGLYQVHQDSVQKNFSNPNIYFSSISSDQKNILSDSSNIVVDYTSNEISFGYRNDNYSTQFRSWETRLLPLQYKWTLTSNTTQSFQELPSGEYEFQVRNKQFGEGKHKSIHFRVLPNPLTSWWFISLIWFAVLLTGYFIYQGRSKRQHAISALKLKNLEFEQRALFNQMNPHFLHNSLFAIQGFILKNDRLKANRLLVSFSGLMEKMLFSSQERSIAIEKELELLEEYLNWQKIRLNNAFSFQIDTHLIAGCLQERIPSMILQPLLENAVEHGIISRGATAKDGNIHVFFKVLEGGVECVLFDNGILKETPEKRESLGVSLAILQERLSILRQMGFDASIRMQRMKDFSGTEVTLHLPFLN